MCCSKRRIEHFNNIAGIVINAGDVPIRKSDISEFVEDAIESNEEMIEIGNGLKVGYTSSFEDTGIAMFLFSRKD